MTEPNFQSGVDMGRERVASAPVLMPGISVYADLRRENYAYVDKTRELKCLLDSGKYLFLARPRRFGKTLMLSTIECMYQGDWQEIRDPFVEMSHFTPQVPDDLLFAGTSWETLGAASPKRPVIRLDLSAVTGNDAETMERSLTRHVVQQALVWYCGTVAIGMGCGAERARWGPGDRIGVYHPRIPHRTPAWPPSYNRHIWVASCGRAC